MSKQRTETIQILFDYLYIENVPIKESEHGDIIDMNYPELEKMAIKAIIRERAPLRGHEVKLFRKLLHFSFEKFASEIGLTSGSIFKWEKNLEERLHPINEVAVRAYLAEKFDVPMPGKYSELIGKKEMGPIVIKLEKMKKQKLSRIR